MLRDFQIKLKGDVYAAWGEQNVYNVMAVLPTGGGKTKLAGTIVAEMQRPTCMIAHRQELVSQMSLALNRERIPHGIIAPKETQKQIVKLHHDTHEYSVYNFRSDVRVAGVDTLIRMDHERWFNDVGLVAQDEGHHVLRKNKWGQAMALFPNALGLFLTAHAVRADGSGLGRDADGLVDRLALGPHCRALISRGFLTDYRILCPQSDLDFSDVPVTASGDFSQPKLIAATHKSKTIVGDVIKHYQKYAAGKLGVTFAVDIEAAKELAAAYNRAGIPAEVITAKTPVEVRAKLMKMFRARQILQLVSVDCLGEGVDVPAIEVISMVRRTASFQLYAQQFGRSLRPILTETEADMWGSFTDEERLRRIAASSKPKAIIIDHVGNCMYHGLPDVAQEYSLDRPATRNRGKTGAQALRYCLNPMCIQPYERYLVMCPYCGTIPTPSGRASPEEVEGDLIELDPAVLAAIRGEVQRIAGPCPETYDGPVGGAIQKHWRARQVAQDALLRTMMLWGGWREHLGEDTRSAQRRFWYTFGVDTMTAQTMKTEEMWNLNGRLIDELSKHNIVENLKQ